MNILITGGSGFIGSNYINFLFKDDKNVNIINIDALYYCANNKNINEEIRNSDRYTFIEGTICDYNLLVKIIKEHQISHIIHFAAQSHVDNSFNESLKYTNDNVLGTHTLLEAIKNTNKQIILLHFSTDEVYGESELNDNKKTEESLLCPTNPYAASKAAAEMYVKSYIYSFNLKIIITRCNNVFGIKQYSEKVIPLFISKALKNESLTIHGNGDKVRDFIHIDDVSLAVITLIEKGSYSDIYNIGIENPINILELAKYIIKKIGKGSIKFTEDRPFNDARYNINFDKLKMLGWSPQNNFYEQLDKVIEWGRENTIKKINILPIKKKLEKYVDYRGYNMSIKTDIIICQQFISKSKKNVIRGIHKSPYDKYVIVLSGKILDYVIDFSNDVIKYTKLILDSENDNNLYIPANFGHIFIALEDNTKVLYQLAGKYDPKRDININYRDPYINLDIPWNNKYILSDKDTNSDFVKPVDYVLMGSKGFLGSEIKKILEQQNKNIICLDTRLENYKEIETKLSIYKPKYVICAAGISGKPTIAWCDKNKEETFKVNVMDTLNLCQITKKLNIHLTLLGSGSVFNGGFNSYGEQIMIEFDEDSKINKNNNKFYLKCRNILENTLELYENVLFLRIQYPIALNDNPKCFMNKMLTRLNSVHDQYVNITFIPNLFPLLSEIIEKNTTSILNFVNKNPIKLTELLELYKKYSNKKFDYVSIKAKNTCGLLSSDKLCNLTNNRVVNIYDAFNN